MHTLHARIAHTVRTHALHPHTAHTIRMHCLALVKIETTTWVSEVTHILWWVVGLWRCVSNTKEGFQPQVIGIPIQRPLPLTLVWPLHGQPQSYELLEFEKYNLKFTTENKADPGACDWFSRVSLSCVVCTHGLLVRTYPATSSHPWATSSHLPGY